MLTKVKLKTNVALTGFVKLAYYNKGKKWPDPEHGGELKQLPDSINLKGSWDGSTDESLFLPASMAGQMFEMGLIRQDPTAGKDGEPRYTVVQTQKKVRVIKVELEGNKKRTYISWADAPPAESAPAQQSSQPAKRAAATPPPSQDRPQPPAKASDKDKPDAITLEKLKRAHRRRLQAIAETTANAWRAGAVELDKFLLERSIEKTKLPSQIYYEMLHSMGSTNAIQAHRENLIVEHRPKKEPAAAPAVRPQAAALQGASALQPISEETTRLEPVKPRGPDDEEDLNDFPGFPNMPGEDDDLPF